ncbi:5'-nucleotidase C-terminal domain-containing protein [Alteribacillus sp. YIM 98480]|uniref:5'-nucleotidase C-terminal domain-containing protein n=1 Tax=Alteribacillus sp. YIM 98480 TaxID=2606599 RepID=UPI00131BDA6F|nr:5'-nucleotidase C-terminal domain-containing protein [Alteribacillus sp. YIM 98480]
MGNKRTIGWCAAALLSILPISEASAAEEISRDEFIKELMDTMDVPVDSWEVEETHFNDVDEEFAPYAEAALELGITNGWTEKEFGTEKSVTGSQALLLSLRALQLENANNMYDSAIKNGKHRGKAAQLGLLQNYESGPFRPNHPITEEQMDELFDRYENNFERLTFVHTNDVHGRLAADEENGEMGLAKIATIADKIENESKSSLVVDLGDAFHGTNVVNFNEGEAAADIMNEIGYDALTAGNHDFNYGYERLLELDDRTDFPVLSGNVVYTESGEEFLTSTHQVKVLDKTIALVGLTAADTPISTHPDNVDGLTFEDEVDAAHELVEEAEKEADHVVLLTHNGYSVDQEIAEKVDGIDLILGGHSHTRIESPEKHGDTFISQAYEHSKAAGITHMVFHNNELLTVNGHLIRDHEELEPDPEVEQTISTYEKEVEEQLSEVIGTIDTTLDGTRELVRTQETNLGNLVTDAMREMTDADIAITNGGGIRDNMEAGDVTLQDVLTAFPFPNTVVAIELTGEQIIEAIEHGIRMYPEQNGGFPHISGAQFTFDPSQEPGARIQEFTINGETLDEHETYVAATNDFLAAGGDGYESFTEGETIFESGEVLSDVISEYITAGKTIPEVDGRIISLD